MSYPFEPNPHGAARFASMEEIRSSGLLGRAGTEFGLLDGKPVRHFKGGGVKITGGSGSGKTSQIALPMIFGSPREVFVVLDFKNGEISRIIGAHTALERIPFYTVDPYGVTALPRLRVSLLSHLKPNSPTLVADAQRFMLALVPDSGGGDSKFFDQSARRFGDALVRGDVHLSGGTSFMTLYNIVAAMRADFDAFSEWTDLAVAAGSPDLRSTFMEMKEMYAGSPKTFDSVMGGLSNALSFMADPNLRECFVDDLAADFPLGVIADSSGPVIVSLVIPDELLDVLAALIRAFISAVRTAKKTRPDAPQVHFLIDEAARMGRFEELAQMFAVDRSAGIVPYLFYQDDGQITRNLGKTGKATMEANAAIMLDLGGGIRDYETAQARSRMLGMQTVEVDDPLVQTRAASAAMEIKRKVLFECLDPIEAALQLERLDYEVQHRTRMAKPLRSPQELMSMPSWQMLMQARAYLQLSSEVEKRPYYVQRRFAGHYLPNENEERDMHSVRVRTRLGMRRRKIIEVPVPEGLAHLPQYSSDQPLRYVEGYRPKS